MKIKFYKVSELDKNLKATIHRTGKMGFTADAANKLDLDTMRGADIGCNEEDLNDKNLYLFLYQGATGDFKVIKAGKYFYINTKVLFDNLKFNYTKETISFDIVPEKYEGRKMYVLKRRVKPKKEQLVYDQYTDDDFDPEDIL